MRPILDRAPRSNGAELGDDAHWSQGANPPEPGTARGRVAVPGKTGTARGIPGQIEDGDGSVGKSGTEVPSPSPGKSGTPGKGRGPGCRRTTADMDPRPDFADQTPIWPGDHRSGIPPGKSFFLDTPSARVESRDLLAAARGQCASVRLSLRVRRAGGRVPSDPASTHDPRLNVAV
jgi:hypothetical protein